MSVCKRVIVDVDVGVDDYLALLILLHAEKSKQVKIEAIVCTNGNTTRENVCKNVIRLLELINRTDIPVYRGAPIELIPPEIPHDTVHGSDGFGGLEYSTTPDLSVIKKEPAAVAVGKLVVENPNEITLICVGPLTNAALAIRLYDGFADCLKEMWIMGGNYTARGNIKPTAEFNFYVDPEAVYIVLNTIKKPIYIVPWETCQLPQIPKEWRYNVFGAKTAPEIQLLTKAERSLNREKNNIWLSCDSYLAAAFVSPDAIISRKSTHHASIELHGGLTRGQVVLDHLKSKKENVTIIEEINTEKYKELLLKL